MKNKIYVGNLPYDTDAENLMQLFSPVGQVKWARITKSAEGNSRGFGFVAFYSETDAKQALSMGGQLYQGRKLYVAIASGKTLYSYPVESAQVKLTH